MARDYISASSINLFLQCPVAYMLKYQLELDTRETDLSFAKYGTLVHKICENIANGEYLFEDEAIQEYESEFTECGVNFDNYFEAGKEGIKNQWKFFENFKIEAIGAEVKFDVKPFEHIPKFFGYIDLVYRNENGDLVVRDYKTSKPYTSDQLSKQIQPYFYSEACLEIYGELPKYFEFDFIRFNQKATIVTNEEFLEFNRLRMKGIWNKISNVDVKCNYDSYYCGHFCGSSEHCPLAKMKRGW